MKKYLKTVLISVKLEVRMNIHIFKLDLKNFNLKENLFFLYCPWYVICVIIDKIIFTIVNLIKYSRTIYS